MLNLRFNVNKMNKRIYREWVSFNILPGLTGEQTNNIVLTNNNLWKRVAKAVCKITRKAVSNTHGCFLARWKKQPHGILLCAFCKSYSLHSHALKIPRPLAALI